MSKQREALLAAQDYFAKRNLGDNASRVLAKINEALAEHEQEPVTMHKVAEERDKLMQMVQEYASTWAIVGGRFDDGSAFEDAKKSKGSIFRQTAKLATISFELGFDKERGVESLPQHSEPKKLWLWKNFVGGKAEYWAFENAYPIHIDNDDPQVIGEPCGYALYKPSRNSGVNRREPSPVASPQPREWQELSPLEMLILMQEVDVFTAQHPEFNKGQREWVMYLKISAALRTKNEVKV